MKQELATDAKRLYKIIESGVEILVVDYSGLKEAAMIHLVTEGRELMLSEKKLQLILSIFNGKTFITPGFMRHFETYKRQEAKVYVKKQIVVGLTEPQKMIIKAFNYNFERNLKAAETMDEAIAYLIDPTDQK